MILFQSYRLLTHVGKVFRRLPFSILMMTFTFTSLVSQDALDIKAWLEIRKGSLESQIRGVANNTFNPSWIRELEFRTETEDFLLDKEEYLLRYRPTMPGVRKAQSRLIDVSRQEWDINTLKFQNDINRYLLDELFRIRKVVQDLAIQQALLELYKDEQKLISRLLLDGQYNTKDLIQVEADLQEISSDIHKNELRVNTLTQNGILPATDQIISIDKLTIQMATNGLQQLGRLDDVEDAFEIAKIDAEIGLEKAEEKRIFDYIQLRYNGPHSDLLREKIAVGIGVEIPHSSDQKLRIEELRVEQMILEQVIHQQRMLDSMELAMDIIDLQLLLETWRYEDQAIADQETSLDRFSNRGIDIKFDAPELILYQKERILKSKLAQVNLENDIYEKYLDILEQTVILGENRILIYILE